MKAYTVVLSPDPAGGYSVSCPAMPGALSEGKTRAEALSGIAEAMGLWFETAASDGYAPREETPELVAAEVAAVLADRAAEGWELLVETATIVPHTAAAA